MKTQQIAEIDEITLIDPIKFDLIPNDETQQKKKKTKSCKIFNSNYINIQI